METDLKLDARLIRNLREDRGWSQEHLATVAGLSSRTVQRLEADGRASLGSRSAIAAAFGVLPNELDQYARTPAVESVNQGDTARAAAVQPSRDGLRITWLAVVVLMFLLVAGYWIGKGMAERDNRMASDAGESCRFDCPRRQFLAGRSHSRQMA